MLMSVEPMYDEALREQKEAAKGSDEPLFTD